MIIVKGVSKCFQNEKAINYADMEFEAAWRIGVRKIHAP